MDPGRKDILREALDTRRRKEALEQALGRSVRKREANFSTYIGIMSELREIARSEKSSVEDAARKVLGEKD
ncbi:MAG: hypothetical protein A3K67_01105 [Euryarchaeota archaeon RBG_16_62_10]|nr:MAG: hypothetical protein A3K67_01105 [Euryarchaeota archaeon RBG_16_62_10]